MDDLVIAITRDVVAEAVPEELPLLPAHLKAFRDNPDRALRIRKSKDEMLGFGIDPGTILLTPVVIGIVSEVLKHLGMDVGAAAAKRGRRVFGAGFNRLARRPTSTRKPQGLPVLTAEQIKEVRALVVERAVDLHVASSKAELLGDLVVSRLVCQPGRT